MGELIEVEIPDDQPICIDVEGSGSGYLMIPLRHIVFEGEDCETKGSLFVDNLREKLKGTGGIIAWHQRPVVMNGPETLLGCSKKEWLAILTWYPMIPYCDLHPGTNH